MKKIFKGSLAIIIGLSLSFYGCKKDSTTPEDNTNNNGTSGIAEKQQSTVMYFGGNWCPPCGAYGKPAKEKIHNEIPDKAVIISCQVNQSATVVDPMNNADANSLASFFKVSSVPTMFFGAADNPMAGMSGSSSLPTNAVAKVNEQAALKPVVNCALSIKEADGLLTVTANGKFFQDGTGEYHIAGYMLEDKLNYPQASDGSTEKNIHYNVLRAKFGTVITGELIKADPKKGDSFSKDLTFFVQPTFVKANLGVAVVIWKKTSTGWVISNSNYIHFK